MTSPVIEAHGLVKTFGDFVAVDDVSFEVPQGTVFGLLGPNGAGKTTTVRMMTTLATPTRGTARVAGHDVVAEPEAVRASMGLTAQSATVDDLLTGRENLRLIGDLYGLPGREVRRRADDLLERFSLAEAGNKVVKDYSGGMRRRLDIAASLINRPRVLFLYEPRPAQPGGGVGHHRRVAQRRHHRAADHAVLGGSGYPQRFHRHPQRRSDRRRALRGCLRNPRAALSPGLGRPAALQSLPIALAAGRVLRLAQHPIRGNRFPR